MGNTLRPGGEREIASVHWMSVLGQKQTSCDAGAMSALPPKADMCSATRYVRFVPIADISAFAVKAPTPTGLHQFSLPSLYCLRRQFKLENRAPVNSGRCPNPTVMVFDD